MLLLCGTNMSNIKKFIIVGGIAALVYYLYNQAMKISITGGYFRIHKLAGTNVELRVFVQVTNEGNSRVDVQNFLGQLLYKGSNVGVVTLLQPTSIPSFSAQEIEFKAIVSGISVGMELYNILLKKSVFSPQDLTIKGTLRAEGLNIPINEPLLSA